MRKPVSLSSFDLQVNGYGGVDFNSVSASAEDFHEACRLLREDGVDSILATVITDEIGSMRIKLAKIVKARRQYRLVREVISGIHIEGPFISPEKGYVGAHPVSAVRRANLEDCKRLLEAADGLTQLVTLAPEQDPSGETVQFLSCRGIAVSAGHCNASLDELERSIDCGLSLFTHLGNGCPMEMHRHDNIIQRALSLSDRIWLCFIPDGVHIPFSALRNYLDCVGVERSIVVTDAIAAARLGPGMYRFSNWEVSVGEDLVARSPDGSHFIGSTVTMPKIFKNLTVELGLSEEEAIQLMDKNPRAAMG